MKYLHGNTTELNNAIATIESAEGITSPNIYCEIQPSPILENQSCIPITNSGIEAHLTSVQQSSLVDTDDYTASRNGAIPTPIDATKILIRGCEQWTDSDYNLPEPWPSINYDASWANTDERRWKLWKMRECYHNTPSEDWVEGFWYRGSAFNIANIESGTDVRFRWRNATPVGFIFWGKEFDYPGNGFHINNNESAGKACMRRAVVSAAVMLCMMYDSENYDHYRWSFYEGAGRIFFETKDFLPKMMRDAFEELLKICYFKYLENRHYGLQSTLDQEQRAGVLFWALGTDASLRKSTLKTFQEKSEFNFRFKKYAGHSLDHDGGIDLAYHGRSERRAFRAYAVAKHLGLPEADHMEVEFNKWAKFRRYQLMPDPDGSYHGPTCRNVGTPENLYAQQGPIKSNLLSRAYYFNDYNFLADRFGLYGIPNSQDLEDDLVHPSDPSSGQAWNNTFDYFYFNDANKRKAEGVYFANWGLETTQTTDQLFKYIPDDEYSVLSSLSSTQRSIFYELPNDFIEKMGDSLFVKLNSGTTDEYGFQLYLGDKGFRLGAGGVNQEVDGYTMGYDCFWTKEGGFASIGVNRGNQRDGAQDLIDATNGDGIYAGMRGGYAHNHIVMERTSGIGTHMSTALSQRDYDNLEFIIDGNDVSAQEAFSSSNPTSFQVTGLSKMKGRDAYDPVNGVITVEEIFTGDSTGVGVEKTLTADGTAQGGNDINNLYETLSLNLKSRRSSITGTLGIRQGGSWTNSPSTGVWHNNVEMVRVVRNGKTVHFVPDATVHGGTWAVRFAGNWQNTVGKDDTIQIGEVDMHPNRGNSVAFPASSTVKYKIVPV